MKQQLIKTSAAIAFLIIVQFSNVVAQQAKTAKEWFELGNKQNEQMQYSQAILSFSECVRLDKTAYTCFINRGVAYFNLKKHTEAISDYSAAIRLNPKSVDAYNNRGVSNVELKKYSEAKSDFTKALEIEPNNKAATDNLAKLEMIMLELAIGNNDWDSDIFKDLCVSGNCENGSGKKVYDNGDTYEGDWVNGKREGQGTLTLKNGDRYTGEWKNDKRHGYGKEYIMATMALREGTWKDGVFVDTKAVASPPPTSNQCVSGNCVNGRGKMVYTNGDIYEGDFVNGKKVGQGTLTDVENGESYKGGFVRDYKHGQGTNTFKNGDIFTGEFQVGFSIKGKIKYANGSVYEGGFVLNSRNGQGTYTTKNGDYHTGGWKDDLPDGYGKDYTKATNVTREGTWKDGVFIDTKAVTSPPTTSNKCVSGNCVNGRGKMVYTNGNSYEGDFVNSKLEGQGTFTVTNGQVYIGQFANDKYNGRGKFTFPTGYIYEGDWIDNKREGQGTLTLPSGEIYIGQFANDARNGRGKNTWSNGDIYEGNWVNDKREGQGVFTSKDGSYYSGEWKNDKSNGFGKDFIKTTNITREGTYKDGLFVNSNTGISIITQFAPKTGTFDNCKFILSVGCRNYIMQSTAAEILPQVKDSHIWQGKTFESNEFNATLVEGTGGIHSVEFKITNSNQYKPAENLKWKENVKSVKKKYGEPLQITVDKNKIFHSYKNFQLVYNLDNNLCWITFARNKTESEITAEQNFIREKLEKERIAKLEAERIANTPEAKAAKITKFYLANKELDSELDKYTADINKRIRGYNDFVAKYGERTESRSMKYEVSGLCSKAIDLIDTFLLVYADQVSPKAKANLLESRKNYLASMKL